MVEMKQTGIVFGVGLAELLQHALVHILAILQGHQTSVILNAAILGNAQEDDAINGLLYGVVQFALGQCRIAQGDISRKLFAPLLDLGEKSRIHASRAAFLFV